MRAPGADGRRPGGRGANRLRTTSWRRSTGAEGRSRDHGCSPPRLRRVPQTGVARRLARRPDREAAVSDSPGNRARELLALPDQDLASAMARSRAGSFLRRAKRRDPARLRAAVAGSGAWATCRHDEALPGGAARSGRRAAGHLRSRAGGDPRAAGPGGGGDGGRLTKAEPVRPRARQGAGRRPRAGWLRDRERDGDRDRLGGAGGCARGGRLDDRRARLRRRSALPAAQRSALQRDRRARSW